MEIPGKAELGLALVKLIPDQLGLTDQAGSPRPLLLLAALPLLQTQLIALLVTRMMTTLKLKMINSVNELPSAVELTKVRLGGKSPVMILKLFQRIKEEHHTIKT